MDKDDTTQTRTRSRTILLHQGLHTARNLSCSKGTGTDTWCGSEPRKAFGFGGRMCVVPNSFSMPGVCRWFGVEIGSCDSGSGVRTARRGNTAV